uniref:Sterile alpha motif domain-containing protein 9-like n=1 Tax=Mastacembelus armatus TaxID=205130 RepID=A0A3Q3M9F0_9TELE
MEDVRRWLVTELKVHETCADTFFEAEVSGDILLLFDKKEILDLGIKHGPTIKITAHLESLKKGSQHESPCPAYVENWSKEQVNQWLVQHVKVYCKYAERLQEEDVSGDCLVCCNKQDLLDLGVKSGPAVKILAALRELNNKPEPTLQPILPNSTQHTETPQSSQPDLGLAQAQTPTQAEHRKTGSKTHEVEESESGKAQVASRKASEPNQPKAQNMGARKETVVVKFSVVYKIQYCVYVGEGKTRSPALKLNNKGSCLLTVHLFSVHTGRLKQLCLSEDGLRREVNQGDKLKNLLTCGGNSLDNYARFIVVVNKSSPDQAQYLQFLNKLKLFCVLDFDPDSAAPGGVCHSYRESRVANLHVPSQYQGPTDSVIKNLNLYKQTSWVFCNGRHDLDSGSNKQLDYKMWLRKSCRDVEQLLSFICNPEVLLHGRSLIVFLLLSPVESEKDPVFDTYRSFLKHMEEENIITICESQSTYKKWRKLIQEKCDFDIDPLSIYMLTLSEVNGTVMALGPFSQSRDRLLPSSDSSSVVLKQKDEDLLTALDILCLNQCENTFDENSPDFQDFRVKIEENFYRGGKVTWWSFYFCDKDKAKPFIKRDKYEEVKRIIKTELRKSSKNPCVLINLFHHPGCGGTTLAMHVMWDLRKTFRCAVLKDNTLPKDEIAIQVIKLMKLESDKPSPVLLLVDDSKETQNPYNVVNCIHQAVENFSNANVDDPQNCKVLILNCVRSHSPKEQYKQHNQEPCQYITASLSKEEQNNFKKKLEELKETHEEPENFYSFMIMKSNFEKKYVEDLASNTLKNFDFSLDEAQLFAFLALLNTYVEESEISLSLCEDFLKMKMIRWREDSLLDRMKPYSNFLIIDKVEEWGGYKGIRILHHSIASACLEELEKKYGLKISSIVMQLLHYDLFFSVGVLKHKLTIRQMLIERQRKKDSDEREPFSPLIYKIHSQEGRQVVQEIFVKASTRFETSASIPQALARYLYINQRDFEEALIWAQKAKNISENSFTCDTIAQVYKNNLKFNIERERQEPSLEPEHLNTNIKLAMNAMKAFKRAQELAENAIQTEAADDKSEDYPRQSYTVYGYVGVLDIAFLVFEVLGRLPFFQEEDPMKKKYFQSFLKQKLSITSVYKDNSEINNSFVKVIAEHEQFLVNLKHEVKETFDILNSYSTYLKQNTEFDSKNHKTVCDHFKKYVDLFLTAPEEKHDELKSHPSLRLTMEIEINRLFLEEKQADTFVGLLQHVDRPAEEIEKITECYSFLHQQKSSIQKQRTKETINYILTNVILHLLKPNSKYVKSQKHLSSLLLETLQVVGLGYPFPDPYYLALLLYWPSPKEENKEIGTYVTAIQNSSRKRFSKLFQKRSTIAHFYLGKGEGLKRLVSKPKLDKSFLSKMHRETLAQLWRNGDIFKDRGITDCLHRVTGITEEEKVFAVFGKMKIPVRPALIGVIRGGFSTEKVSFYLGFAINGLLAYDIQYEN